MLPLQDTIRSRSLPLVNWTLIIINLAAFLFVVSRGRFADAWVVTFGLVPARFLFHLDLGNILTLFTSMFLHGGWAHLLSNLLALWIFGDNVEDRMGSRRYLLFYLTCGVVAALAHIAFNPTSPTPTIGASGAISGVLAAYLISFPAARVITLVPLFFLPWFVEIPAILYLGLWFVSQLFNGVFAVVTDAQALGGVAWWAHIGGFVAGLCLAPLFARRRYVRRIYVD
ncbi:MAG: rhomboid family intramembrane serine protease, partial [Anaerolineae bacterium]|nr:rhomboid family intramembrane serine protease [Anaerolineae bacterium]